MKGDAAKPNTHETREGWLRAATNGLRPYFESCGFPLPAKIRFAIAFPSTGRTGNRVGECWHASASTDEHYEVIVRADKFEPVEVLGILVHELVHAVLPPTTGHGKAYREAAQKLGLVGQMRYAMPGTLLQERLNDLAATLGPLPHASLRIADGRDGPRPVDRPKKQRARMLKAECPQCEKDGAPYLLRIAAAPVRRLGPPICPKHRGAMRCELPPVDDETADDIEEVEATAVAEVQEKMLEGV